MERRFAFVALAMVLTLAYCFAQGAVDPNSDYNPTSAMFGAGKIVIAAMLLKRFIASIEGQPPSGDDD